jgi:multidrug efflux system membrane fusion protein
VTIATASQKDVPVQVQVIGAVESYSNVTVKSRVAGQIVKVGFQQGQNVKKGDLLFEIDRRPFEVAVALAKAQLLVARANLDQAKARLRQAERDWDRAQKLGPSDALSQTQYDAYQSAYETSAAGVEAADAQVAADQAAIDSAQVQLDYCTITSTLDGRTGSLMVFEGGDLKNDDTSLVLIDQVQPIYVTFSVAEKYLPLIRQYMATNDKPLAVEAAIPQTSEPPERGELTFVDNQVDHTTGMIQLKGTFTNQDRRLWPGQFVKVGLTLTTRANAVVVPSQAIQTGQAGQFIFVVKPDNTVELRPVTPGDIWQELTVIEKGDIRPGETVVTDGQLRLVNGSKVSIKNPPASQPARTTVARAE